MSGQRSSSVFIRSAVAFLLLLSEVRATTSDDQHGYNESSYSSTTAVKRRRSPAANVDRVESIEVEPTQITIITTKQGPVESLKIHIEMIDLQDNRALPPIDLFGLFLVVARGRYTVPFLKPERWYGLTFTSENQVNGQTNEHREQRLLRTASRQMEKISPEQLYKVYMHRNQDGEENVEQLYVTSMWTGPERIPHGELHVEVNVHCKTSTITEHMVLHSDEDSVTIEITMDLNYDIQHLNDSTHQIMARITPMKCSQVCWRSCVVVLPGPAEFRADTDLQCHTIEETTSITHLRHIKQYAVEKQLSGYELVVDTELHEDSEEGFVTLSALNLAKNDSKAKTKTFRVTLSNGTFHLPLAPDSVYAAGYEYTKLKPFRITTAEHFLLETAPLNSSTPANPLLEIKFHSENHTIGDLFRKFPQRLLRP
ncbi:hypothetical protein Q1695_006263 [Nippostrongylus brasiliensis]|nr:hypothetical protein Q1695_006263 [Nippostrongylus brasiliensis]